MAALTKAEMAEALFDQLGLNKREARELVDLFFEEIRAALSSGEQVKLSGFGNFDLRDKNRRPGRNPMADLAGIKTPTLVMHGQEDRLIPFADGQGFARTIPGAVLIAYPGVGHVPMEQIPERSANDLDRWLRTKVWPAPAGAIDPGPAAGK